MSFGKIFIDFYSGMLSLKEGNTKTKLSRKPKPFPNLTNRKLYTKNRNAEKIVFNAFS